MRDERYIEIPGSKTHELPPLLVHSAAEHSGDEDEGDLAAVMSEADDMLAASDVDEVILDRRRYDLALQLKEQYKGMLSHWLWVESALSGSGSARSLLSARIRCVSYCIRMSGRTPIAPAS